MTFYCTRNFARERELFSLKQDVCISRKKDGTFFYEIGTHLLYIRMVFSAGVIGPNKGPEENNVNNL